MNKILKFILLPILIYLLGFHFSDICNYFYQNKNTPNFELSYKDNTNYDKLNNIMSKYKNGHYNYENSELKIPHYIYIVKKTIPILYNNFSIKQLEQIDNINLLSYELINDSLLGFTTYYNDNKIHFDIYISVCNDDFKRTLMHEIWHTIHIKNELYFNDSILKLWKSDTIFVNEYAKTSLKEDIAETGTFFIFNDSLSKTKKNILTSFYNFTK